MRSAVARALGETQMRLLCQVIDALGCEALDGFGQPFRIIRGLDRLGNLRLRQFGAVQDERFVFDERPFDGSFRAIDIDAFAVLPRDVEERAIDARAQVRTFEFDVGALDGERLVVFFHQFLANRA